MEDKNNIASKNKYSIKYSMSIHKDTSISIPSIYSSSSITTNPHYTYNLKKIIEFIGCINENILLINSLMALSHCKDIVKKLISRTLTLYKKLLKHISCNKNYYFIKCFKPKFVDFRKKVCKMDNKKLKGDDYDKLYKIYEKQKTIFGIFNGYKNRVELKL